MPELEMSSKPQPQPQPQISEMFSKFALAFKAKTFEFFAEEDDVAPTPTTTTTTDLDFTLLLEDSAEEEFITDQKVVVIKPDPQQTEAHFAPTRPTKTQVPDSFIPSLFATISSFEASYLHLQTAHVPYHEDTIKTADKTLVSHLQRLSDLRQWYRNYLTAPHTNLDLPIGSCSEAHVQENQSKLRCLETVFNRLQAEIDEKGDRVVSLKQELDKMHKSNAKLSKKLVVHSSLKSKEIVLTVRVFDSMLREACRSMHGFTKLLIELMKKANWDLDLAANSVHSGIDYAKKGHNRYAFLSYVMLCPNGSDQTPSKEHTHTKHRYFTWFPKIGYVHGGNWSNDPITGKPELYKCISYTLHSLFSTKLLIQNKPHKSLSRDTSPLTLGWNTNKSHKENQDHHCGDHPRPLSVVTRPFSGDSITKPRGLLI